MNKLFAQLIALNRIALNAFFGFSYIIDCILEEPLEKGVNTKYSI